MRLAAVHLALAAASWAASADEIRLGRIRYHMAQNLTEIPNYTCTQTIERSVRPARGRQFRLLDTLRLEVALVDGRELFAWPGAGKFEDKKINDMVGGTIGNGVFAGFARAVFLGQSAAFDYQGERTTGGEPLFHYRFDVPRKKSGYSIKVGIAEAIVGYKGEFENHTQTLDLRTLEVVVTEFPSTIPLSSSTVRVQYQRTAIGDREFLLPDLAQMTMVNLDGSESRNVTRFSACRQYHGESVLRFDDPVDITPANQPVTVAVTLPPGLIVEGVLDQQIVFGKTAIGDVLEGRLTAPARIKGRVMAPKGAKLQARLTGIERRQGVRGGFDVKAGIQLESIEFPGARAAVSAILVEAGPMIQRNVRAGVGSQGTLWLSGTMPELPRGVRLVWRVTETPSKEEK